jgi:hypothetical protein
MNEKFSLDKSIQQRLDNDLKYGIPTSDQRQL